MNVTGRVVTPSGVIDDGVVSVSGGRITSVSTSDTVHSGHWIVPGFVDIHVHGGGGYTFTTGDPEQARGAAAFHLRHGTTTLLASLVSSPFALMLAAPGFNVAALVLSFALLPLDVALGRVASALVIVLGLPVLLGRAGGVLVAFLAELILDRDPPVLLPGHDGGTRHTDGAL